jgi:hypothetical protein
MEPKSSCSTSEVWTVGELCQIQEACESDEQRRARMEGARIKSWPGTSEACPIASSGDNAVLHCEFENGATCHKSDCEQQDEVTCDSNAHTPVSTSDFVLLCVGDSRSDEIAVKHDALHDLMVARSKANMTAKPVLSNSEPSLLQLSETDSAIRHQLATVEMPALSSPSLPVSSSVPDLSPVCEGGKSRTHDGFTPTKLRSRVRAWKTDCGAIISSLPNIFHAINSPKQNKCKHTSKPKEFEEKPMQKEDAIMRPKSSNVMKPTDQDCKDRLTAVDTTSLLRSQDEIRIHVVEPQDEAEIAKEQTLYGIQWNFPELRKRSCSNIAKFALDFPLNDEKQVPHQMRPRSTPPDLRKSLQHLLC